MKRLYRSKNERMLSGVCAGLGLHLDIDPPSDPADLGDFTLLSFGTGIIISILAWIINPEDDTGGAGRSSGRLQEIT
jgi:phage shock protein PspC (stress-responsive transcriptional regulator)